jgi:acyl carrier protein
MAPEAVVAETFGIDLTEIDDSSSPDTVAAWDSLGHVTLIIQLEAAYGVSFAPEETMAMTNVGAIKEALSTHGAHW